jgi:hypothetical protein
VTTTSGGRTRRGWQADGDESTTPTTEPTTTTAAPTTSTLPAAIDGSDVEACVDGDCEVLVVPSVALRFDPAIDLRPARSTPSAPGASR